MNAEFSSFYTLIDNYIRDFNIKYKVYCSYDEKDGIKYAPNITVKLYTTNEEDIFDILSTYPVGVDKIRYTVKEDKDRTYITFLYASEQDEEYDTIDLPIE